MIVHSQNEEKNPSKVLLRLKPEFMDKVVRKGYSGDPTGKNKKTMGMLLDLDRVFRGYQSPLESEWSMF